jgi:glycosyltransferase involved in cell wall biosynthesis
MLDTSNESVALAAPSASEAPSVLVVSHVLPFPGSAGQEKRVANTLAALRRRFQITFLTFAHRGRVREVESKLREFCDEAVVLPSRYTESVATRWTHAAASIIRGTARGLRRSNYLIGELELSADRVTKAVAGRSFAFVLFEYWHASASTACFRQRGIPCVLDTHDVLWRSYDRELCRPWHQPFRPMVIRAYCRREVEAWKRFDAVIAINRAEQAEIVRALDLNTPVYFAPMGTDLQAWDHPLSPAKPARLGFYGGLGSIPNMQSIQRCLRNVMPRVWARRPDAEVWFVGNNPPDFLKSAASDPRVKVTGFLPDPAPLLSTMSAILCPWTGKYGFRSRLIEVMALGVPVIASTDAVHGMGLEDGRGLLLADDDGDLADLALRLIEDEAAWPSHSEAARAQVKPRFSLESTYGQLVRDLEAWLEVRTSAV